MSITVGAEIPAADLQEGAPDNKVTSSELFGKGKHILFGVPGAFTPTCHKSHLPSFLEKYDSIKAAGVESIVCVSVNDAFVMGAWAESTTTSGKIRMVADPCGEFVKSMGLSFEVPVLGLGQRSKRFVMIIDDGKVTHLNVEPDNHGASCTFAKDIMPLLSA